MSYQIRQGEAADCEAIASFNECMAKETEDRILDPVRIREGVKRLLEDPQHGFYLVAESDGHLIGQTMVTYEWSDWRNYRILWIQSVYVHADHRRCGVFRALFEKVREIVNADSEVGGVRLYVEKHNDIAKSVYRALGFDKTEYDLFEIMF